MIDKIKIGLAVAVIFAGVFAPSQLPKFMGADVSPFIGLGALLGCLLVGTLIALSSQYGVAGMEFLKGSQIELKKMVWPTRAETIQTTTIVLVLVIVVALFLWAIDALVFNLIYDLLLGVDKS